MPEATLPGALLAWVVLTAAALPALGAAAMAARARPWARAAGLLLSLLAGAAALAFLAVGGGPVRLALPARLAGLPLGFALDGLSAFVIVALAPMGAVAVAAGPARAMAVLGAALAVLLAGHAATLGLALAALLAMRPRGARAPLVAVLVPLGAAAALALPAADGSFAALRAAAAQGVAGWAFPLLVAVAWAGLLRTDAATRSGDPSGPALSSGLAVPVALYLPVRLLADLGGPLAPAWWSLPLLLLAALVAVRGALRGLAAADLAALGSGARQALAGWAGMGIAMALAARAADDGPAAAMALAAALFAVFALGWQQALLALVGSAVARGAGSTRLDRLGGLARGMRFTTGAALVAALALAVLPPGAGFAAAWMVAQAAVLLPRGGGLDWWAMGILAMAALALSGALLTAAAVRWVGVVFLGRPRTPRAAAAEEMPPAWRWMMLFLSAAMLLAGAVPGLVLLLAAPAMRMLGAGAVAGTAGLLAVAPGPEEPGYAAPGMALLLGLAVLCVALLLRARPAPAQRSTPTWDGGQGPAPAWLPFGDPATQLGPHGMAQPVLASLAPLLAGWPRPGRYRRLAGVALGRALALGRSAGPAAAGALLLALLAASWGGG